MSAAIETIGHNNPPLVPEFEAFAGQLAELSARYEGKHYDLDDPIQEKQARADRRTLGGIIADLDRVHQTVKAPLLEQTRVIDGERKRIKDGLLTVQASIKDQIAEKEKREADRVESIGVKILAIREFGDIPPGSDSVFIESRLDAVRDTNINDGYEEFKGGAALAVAETSETLETLLAEVKQREAEAAELAELRKQAEAKERAEREERIRREATERAEAKAKEDAAEKEKVAAEEKVAAKRKAEQAIAAEKVAAAKAIADAEAKAKRAAREERERIEAGQKADEEKAAKKAQAEAKRKAAKAHRERIENEATQSLIAAGMDKEISGAIVFLIASGCIAHLSISY